MYVLTVVKDGKEVYKGDFDIYAIALTSAIRIQNIDSKYRVNITEKK